MFYVWYLGQSVQKMTPATASSNPPAQSSQLSDPHLVSISLETTPQQIYRARHNRINSKHKCVFHCQRRHPRFTTLTCCSKHKSSDSKAEAPLLTLVPVTHIRNCISQAQPAPTLDIGALANTGEQPRATTNTHSSHRSHAAPENPSLHTYTQ